MTSLPPFRVGALVRLKSGGPLMTVANVELRDVFCCWYDKREGFYGFVKFPCSTLQAARKRESDNRKKRA